MSLFHEPICDDWIFHLSIIMFQYNTDVVMKMYVVGRGPQLFLVEDKAQHQYIVELEKLMGCKVPTRRATN